MDWSSIIVAFLSFCGTLSGSLYAMRKTGNLIEYRLTLLEAKVDKHNDVIERTFRLEDKTQVIEERLNIANTRIEKLENEKEREA